MAETGCNSITAKAFTYKFLLKKLRSHAIVLLRVMKQLFHLDKLTNEAEARQSVQRHLQAASSREWFLSQLHKQELQELIVACIQAAIRVSCRPDLFSMDAEMALHNLFGFLLRLCSEKPALLLQDDDSRGSQVGFLQESMENFIAECLVI